MCHIHIIDKKTHNNIPSQEYQGNNKFKSLDKEMAYNSILIIVSFSSKR